MRCTMRNCKNVRELDPVSKLCPPCNAWQKDFNKRVSGQERRQSAREGVQNQNRNLNPSPSPASNRTTSPSTQQASAVTPPIAAFRTPVGSGPDSAPPPIDVQSLQNSYNQLKNSKGSPVTLDTLHGQTLDMFALMLNIHSKMSETDAFRSEVTKANTRIDALEAKVGGINEVSEKLGLAIRFLPLPPTGFSDLDIARQILAEIRAPGIDVNRDVVKAVRKIPSKPPNINQPILGTVLVEMKNEESRASIMKNKHSLQHHPDNTIRSVIIKNMKSREQMMIENLGNNILKRIPGCESTFVANNGQLREGLNQPPHPQNPPRFGAMARSQHQPSLNRPQYNLRNQQPNHHRNFQPNNPPPQQLQLNQPGYHSTQYQPQSHQDYREQPVFENNAAYTPMNALQPPLQHHSSVPMPTFPTPPPVVVPQHQGAPALLPIQDLLGSFANVYEQTAGPSRHTEPDLHLLQPAEPHHGYPEQLHHQQSAQAEQEHPHDQVRADISESD